MSKLSISLLPIESYLKAFVALERAGPGALFQVVASLLMNTVWAVD